VFDAIPRDVYGADNADRRRLLRASRTVERLAVDGGDGTVHAGFQAYSRLLGHAGTVRVYERLLDDGVTLHLYGDPDASLPADGVGRARQHGLPADEVGESWFVVFDGGGDGRRRCPRHATDRSRRLHEVLELRAGRRRVSRDDVRRDRRLALEQQHHAAAAADAHPDEPPREVLADEFVDE
jgi:hypothetical protein